MEEILVFKYCGTLLYYYLMSTSMLKYKNIYLGIFFLIVFTINKNIVHAQFSMQKTNAIIKENRNLIIQSRDSINQFEKLKDRIVASIQKDTLPKIVDTINTTILNGTHPFKDSNLSIRISDYFLPGKKITIVGYKIDSIGEIFLKLKEGWYLLENSIIKSELYQKNYAFLTRYKSKLISIREIDNNISDKYRFINQINLKIDQYLSLISRWGEKNGNRLFEGNIWIGMNKEMFKEVRGYPNDINRTVTANLISEQWVYKGYEKTKYYYFENEILTSWQD